MLDIKAFCHKFQIQIRTSGHHHSRSGWVQLTPCPFCGSRNWHLGFSLTRGNFVCWRCGGLRFWDVMAAFLRTSDRDEIRRLIKDFQKDSEHAPKSKTIRERLIAPPPGLQPLTEAHAAYLADRGFTVAEIEQQWGLKATTFKSGDWNWRIVFPILNGDDQIVAYQGRVIGKDAKPRYKLTDERFCLEDPMSLIYGIHAVKGDSVVVVEGATDVWRLGPGAVATLGIKWNTAQANKLRRFKKRFVMYDPDPDGETGSQQKAREVAEHLSQFPGKTELLSGFDSDAGDFSDEFATNLMKELGVR